MARRAFTLIEILIVVVILGILAGIIIPNVTGASTEARQAVLRDELRFMRTQLAAYQASHASAAGIDPVSHNPSDAALQQQLTNYTDFQGNASTTQTDTFRFGPYLSQIPPNPVTNRSGIKILNSGDAVTVDSTTGWLYKPDTLQFFSNDSVFGPGGAEW